LIKPDKKSEDGQDSENGPQRRVYHRDLEKTDRDGADYKDLDEATHTDSTRDPSRVA
jgi:hypothetical protein